MRILAIRGKNLAELLERKNEAERLLNNANEVLINVSDKRLFLKQYEDLAVVKDAFTEKNNQLKIIDDQRKELLETEELMKNIEEELKSVREKEQKFIAESKSLSEEKKRNRPLFEEANRLDILTENLTNRLSEIELNLSEAHFAVEKATAEKNENENDKISERRALKIKDLEKWFEVNAARQPITENIMEIELKLKEASERYAKISDAEKRSLIHISNIELLKYKIAEEQKILTVNKLNWEDEKRICSEIETEKSTLVIDVLLNDKAQLLQRRADIDETLKVWNVLFTEKTKEGELKQKINDLLSKEKNLQQRKDTLKKDLDISNVKLEQTKKMTDAARTAVFEDVNSIRNQLIAGKPCPVCGSLEHPYVGQTNELTEMFGKFEKELLHCKGSVNKLNREFLTIDRELTLLHENYIQFENNAILSEAALLVSNLNWKKTVLFDECQYLEFIDVCSHLESEKKKVAERLMDIAQGEDFYRRLSDLLNEHNKSINELRNIIAESENRLAEYVRECDAEGQKLSTSLSEKNTNEYSFDNIVSRLDHFFRYDDRPVNRKKDPDDFLNKALLFSELWKNKITELVENRNSLLINERLSLNLSESLDDAEKNEKNIFDKLNIVRIEKEEIEKKRSRILNGKPVIEVEEDFNLRIPSLSD